MSGDWYRCLKAHVTCIKKFEDNVPLRCHECNETGRNSNSYRSAVVEDVEYGLDEPDTGEASQYLVAKQPIKVVEAIKKSISKSETKTSDSCTNDMKYFDPFLGNSNRRSHGRVMQTDRTRKNLTERTISTGKSLPFDVKANTLGKWVPRFPKCFNTFKDSIAGKNAAAKIKSTDCKLHFVKMESMDYKLITLDTEAKRQDKHRNYSALRRPREVLKDSRAGRNAAVKVKSTDDNLPLHTEAKSQDKLSYQSFLNPNSLKMSGEVLKNSRAGRNAVVKVKSTNNNLPLDTGTKGQNKLSSQSYRSSKSVRRVSQNSTEDLKDSKASRNKTDNKKDVRQVRKD